MSLSLRVCWVLGLEEGELHKLELGQVWDLGRGRGGVGTESEGEERVSLGGGTHCGRGRERGEGIWLEGNRLLVRGERVRETWKWGDTWSPVVITVTN